MCTYRNALKNQIIRDGGAHTHTHTTQKQKTDKTLCIVYQRSK